MFILIIISFQVLPLRLFAGLYSIQRFICKFNGLGAIWECGKLLKDSSTPVAISNFTKLSMAFGLAIANVSTKQLFSKKRFRKLTKTS